MSFFKNLVQAGLANMQATAQAKSLLGLPLDQAIQQLEQVVPTLDETAFHKLLEALKSENLMATLNPSGQQDAFRSSGSDISSFQYDLARIGHRDRLRRQAEAESEAKRRMIPILMEAARQIRTHGYFDPAAAAHTAGEGASGALVAESMQDMMGSFMQFASGFFGGGANQGTRPDPRDADQHFEDDPGAPAEAMSTSSSPSATMTDEQKAMRFSDIDSRFLMLKTRMMPGTATEELVGELEGILAEYQALINGGPPTFSLYDMADLHRRQADVHETIGRTHESLNQVREAIIRFDVAEAIYSGLGDAGNAARLRERAEQAKFSLTADVDATLRRLRSELDRIPQESLRYAEKLAELADLQAQSGDDFEATRMYRRALSHLRQIGFPEPGQEDLSALLSNAWTQVRSGASSDPGQSLETRVSVRGLYSRLYIGLSQSLQQSDPDAAMEFLDRAQSLSDGDLKVDQIESMLSKLQEEKDRLFRTIMGGDGGGYRG